jgi:hypothetical protein
MKNQQFVFRILVFFGAFVLSYSCVKDTDFDQAVPVILTPTLEVSLVQIEETPVSFLNSSGAEVLSISDAIVLELLSEDFVIDYLVKAEFIFEITNSLNKAFDIRMDFYDTSNTLQHTFSIAVNNSPTNTLLLTEHIEVFEAGTLDALKTSTNLNITITLISSPTEPSLTTASEGVIALKSKAVLFLNIAE